MHIYIYMFVYAYIYIYIYVYNTYNIYNGIFNGIAESEDFFFFIFLSFYLFPSSFFILIYLFFL